MEMVTEISLSNQPKKNQPNNKKNKNPKPNNNHKKDKAQKSNYHSLSQ